MNLLKLKGDDFVFGMGTREKRLFTELLKLYPLIPPSHHQVTRSSKNPALESHQRLLDEALAEQRTENKKHLETMLAEQGRFKPMNAGFQFSINQYQIEWLLQVLNDIRVGSWLVLGEPDEKNGKPLQLTADNAQYVFALEECAYFQAVLLQALEGKEDSH